MSLKGIIYEYDTVNHLIAFSSNIKSKTNIILVGGLYHNLLSLPYTKTLYRMTKKKNINLIIPQFRSHPNFGIYSIDNDVTDLSNVIKDLQGDIILLGNSTGCQVIMLYINLYVDLRIKLCILQGAVSDTEYFEYKYKINSQIQNDKLFYFENVVYTKERFKSLYFRYNKEDLFSSYLDDDHFKNLNKNNYKLIFVISGNDEYGIKDIKEKFNKVTNSEVIVFEGGDHFLKDKESQKKLIKLIKKN